MRGATAGADKRLVVARPFMPVDRTGAGGAIAAFRTGVDGAIQRRSGPVWTAVSGRTGNGVVVVFCRTGEYRRNGMPLDGEGREGLTGVPAASDWSSPPDWDLSYSDFRFDEETDRVGEGGNAVVYRAHLPDEGLTVALKEPESGKTVPTATVDRLRSEGEQWARIDDHPYVAGVVDWGVVPKPWIAIEYLDGGTLSEYVGSVSLEQRLWTAYAIVDGVAYANRKGITHNDVKPSNVLFEETPDGVWNVPKVVDWGLARDLAERRESISQTTPEYAAPEHLDSVMPEAPVNEQTDVYQLGVVCYELLTGHRPDHLDGETPTPSSIEPSLPESVDRTLVRAMARDQSDRFEHALLLRKGIEDCIAEFSDRRGSAAQAATEPGSGRAVAGYPGSDRAQTDRNAGASPDLDERARDSRVEVDRIRRTIPSLDPEQTTDRTIPSLDPEQTTDRFPSERLPEDTPETRDETSFESDISPGAALTDTRLFVRYDSTEGPDLDDVVRGDADRRELAANVRLEFHTPFDCSATSVADRPFEEFFRETLAYRFHEWVVTELPFEIRATGGEAGLGDLYDAIPRIDRAEFEAGVEVESEEGPANAHEQFDFVASDRLGNPLVVADFDDTREPVTGGAMRTLVEAATTVSESHDTLAAAFFLTSSFFEPEALEVVEAETGGRLLDFHGRESFVERSRNRGYHLCLVEASEGGFSLVTPDLSPR
jgi:serine/threonine protein kinase